ncbi:uncharacterized protein K460DRAFT_268677, partial [Cucurbitaria berberidis CBS 394.84]
LAALAVASPLVTNIERGDAPDVKDIRIKSVTVFGTGCPPGSVSGDVGENSTLIALTYAAYEAATGQGKSITDARKFCNVRVGLEYPAGWSYTVAKTVIRGYVNVPQKCSASLSALFYFSGSSEDAECSVTFPGGSNKRYTEETSVDALVWSRCGAKDRAGPLFNVNSDARVNCKDAGVLGVDTQDTKFEMQLLLQWKKC